MKAVKPDLIWSLTWNRNKEFKFQSEKNTIIAMMTIFLNPLQDDAFTPIFEENSRSSALRAEISSDFFYFNIWEHFAFQIGRSSKKMIFLKRTSVFRSWSLCIDYIHQWHYFRAILTLYDA